VNERAGAGRGSARPQLVDQPVDADEVAATDQQDGQDRAGLRGAQLERPTTFAHLDRTEHSNVHRQPPIRAPSKDSGGSVSGYSAAAGGNRPKPLAVGLLAAGPAGRAGRLRGRDRAVCQRTVPLGCLRRRRRSLAGAGVLAQAGDVWPVVRAHPGHGRLGDVVPAAGCADAGLAARGVHGRLRDRGLRHLAAAMAGRGVALQRGDRIRHGAEPGGLAGGALVLVAFVAGPPC
jgi:hypothetical protein